MLNKQPIVKYNLQNVLVVDITHEIPLRQLQKVVATRFISNETLL